MKFDINEREIIVETESGAATKPFYRSKNSEFKIGNLEKVVLAGKTYQLAVIDALFEGETDDQTPKVKLKDLKPIEGTSSDWVIKYFDGHCPWSVFEKWVDMVDNDGDVHHCRLTRFFDMDDPRYCADQYILEVDLDSE